MTTRAIQTECWSAEVLEYRALQYSITPFFFGGAH